MTSNWHKTKEWDIFIIMVVIIAILGNIFVIIATMNVWLLNMESKWVWLLSAVGWGFFAAALGDLLNTSKGDNTNGK